MWVYICVKIVLIILATICFYLGYIGIKELKETLKGTMEEADDV